MIICANKSILTGHWKLKPQTLTLRHNNSYGFQDTRLSWTPDPESGTGSVIRDQFRVFWAGFISVGFILSTCAMSKCGPVFFFEEVHYFWPQSWSVEFNLKRWNAWRNKWNVSWTFVRGWSRLWLARGVARLVQVCDAFNPKPPSNGNTNHILHVIRIFKI